MAKLVFSMNQTLDGYVDHTSCAPSRELFRHFVEMVGSLAGSLYGRRVYELMQYWDEDQPDWTDDERAFAIAWRAQPKWVLSRTLTCVGPNASLIEGDVEVFVRDLKQRTEGEIAVAGPEVAHMLSDLDLIDEFRIYLHPVVLGSGKPYFAGPRPPLRLLGVDRIDADVIRLSYAPA